MRRFVSKVLHKRRQGWVTVGTVHSFIAAERWESESCCLTSLSFSFRTVRHAVSCTLCYVSMWKGCSATTPLLSRRTSVVPALWPTLSSASGGIYTNVYVSCTVRHSVVEMCWGAGDDNCVLFCSALPLLRRNTEKSRLPACCVRRGTCSEWSPIHECSVLNIPLLFTYQAIYQVFWMSIWVMISGFISAAYISNCYILQYSNSKDSWGNKQGQFHW